MPTMDSDADSATSGYTHPDDLAILSEPMVPGLDLMSRGDLDRAVGDTLVDGDYEDSSAPSREELVRRRELARFRDDPDRGRRRYLVADDAMLARLAQLGRDAPNIAGAVEVVRRSAVLSRHAGLPLRIPPLLLLGPPGTGKSRFVARLKSALDTTSETIVGSSMQDTGPLTGYSTAWRGAGPGIVARALMTSTTASPLIVIDEAEKISSWDRRSNPLDALLAVMEPETACRFKDNYYDVPMRADYVIFILITNSLHGLSEPLVDRCVVVDAPALSGAERRRALDELAADVALDHGVGPQPLDDACAALLDGLGGLRRARAVVTAALAAAVEAGRHWLSAADVRDAALLLGGAAERPTRAPVGFMHF